jgi:hypothetical protein
MRTCGCPTVRLSEPSEPVVYQLDLGDGLRGGEDEPDDPAL